MDFTLSCLGLLQKYLIYSIKNDTKVLFKKKKNMKPTFFVVATSDSCELLASTQTNMR